MNSTSETRELQLMSKILQLDVSDKGHVWGINKNQNIFRWTGFSWQHIGGKAVQVTVGPSGVWVVSQNQNVYYRKGTYLDKNTAGSGVSPTTIKNFVPFNFSNHENLAANLS